MANRDASNTAERKYQCKFCPKRFTRSSVLTDHIRVHTGEKPFKCKVCLKSFSQLTNLNRHHKIHNNGQTLQTYPDISFENQTAVPSSSNANSNQAGNIRSSVQLGSKNLTSLSNFLQIPSSNLEEDEIFALNQALSLNADAFGQQIQTNFESGNIAQANNSQNTHDAILVSDESQESLSFDQQISHNFSEGSDVPNQRGQLDLSKNISIDSKKCFYNTLERNPSSFGFTLRAPSDELEVIDIKPDLSALSPVNKATNINAVVGLNTALQCPSSSQDDFVLTQQRDLNNTFENIQYFKSENELCFDNNEFPPAASNDYIQGSASGMKSFNNSLPNISLAAVPSTYSFENSHAYNDSVNRISQNRHIENSSNIYRDVGSSNVVLLNPPSSFESTSQQSSPQPHLIQKNQVALNYGEKSISCNFDDGSNGDVFIKSESSLEKTFEGEIGHQRELDTPGKITAEEVLENSSIVIESVYSMNDEDNPELSAREGLSENPRISSLAVKHLEFSDQHKKSSEVEVINLEDFSPKEMGSNVPKNWSVPLVDIKEITTQRLDSENDFEVQATENENGLSKEPNSVCTKGWDYGYVETNSQEPLSELTPTFQQTTNNNAKKVPDLSPKHVISLEFSCNRCEKDFSDKSSFLSHLCSSTEASHLLKNPCSPLVEDVNQVHLKPRGLLLETAENSQNLTKSHLSQTENLTCKYCNKHFSDLGLLVKHIETYIDNKASTCDLCRRPFSQLTNLTNSESKQCSRNGLLECQFCEKTFQNSFPLLNHLKNHARSIQRNIKDLEGEIRQKQRKKVDKKSLKAKYLKVKSKSMQLPKENLNQLNGRNSSIPVLHLGRSHFDPRFNAVSPKNDENLNPKDFCNKQETKKRPIGLKCLNSIEVSGNLIKNTSSDSFIENSSTEECVNISRSFRQEKEKGVDQIEFPFSENPTEDQSKVYTDSGGCTEQFRFENNSLNILESSKSEETNKSLENDMVSIQPSELVHNIEYKENLAQEVTLPTIWSSSPLSKSHSRDQTTCPDDQKSDFGSAVETATANISKNICGAENSSEVIFVTSNCAADIPDGSSLSNPPEKSGGQFHCKLCNKSFNRKFIFIKHLQTHTEEKLSNPRSFSQSSNLSRHRKSHLIFPCKFCPTKYQSISELNAHHRELHMGMKSYNCKFCSKTFSRSSVLKEHIRTHTGEKPFVCELCNRAFSQATNLNRHMKVHVPGRVFHCRHCSQTFKQYWHLKRHLKTHIHFGKMSNDDAFIRKTKRQPIIHQMIPRRIKCLKSNDIIHKLSENNDKRSIQYRHKKNETSESKQGCLGVIGSYEPAAFPDLLKDNSSQYGSNFQPHGEELPNIARTPEILAINGQLLPATNNTFLQSVATPTGLVPNIRHESFQPSHGDDLLDSKVPSNYALLSTSNQNEMSLNESSSSFGLVNSFTKHNVFGRVNTERNDSNNSFANPDCKFLREADDANDDNLYKDNSRSNTELSKNGQNSFGTFLRAALENQVKTNSRSKDSFNDNYESVRDSRENENAVSLINPILPSSVNVKIEPEHLNIEKQSGLAPETFNSDSLRRNESVVSFEEFRCIYCNKLFHHSQVLCRHLRSHHKSEMMMTSTCQLCHTSFPDSDSLSRHRKTCSHLLLPYFCNLCKEKFPNSSELNRHRQRKHSGGIKRYPCRYCTKVFTRNSVLTEHIRTHTGEKPYVCELCLRAFSQATNLKRHQKIHARNGSYVCKYCKASFSQLSFLSRHLRMHTEEQEHQDSAMAGCQLENPAAPPFREDISENLQNGQNLNSRASWFAPKDSTIAHIDPGTLTKTLTNNDSNKSFKKTLSNVSIEQLENYEIENNSEAVTMQEQLCKTLVSSDTKSDFSLEKFGQIDTTMEGLGMCYTTLRRDLEKKPREIQKDDFSVNVAGRTQGVVIPSVPIIPQKTHFPAEPNFLEQQREKDSLELSDQPVIDIDLSIVKREDNQSDTSSLRSCDQQNFQLYDSSQQTMPSILQIPDLKPMTPNIEIHGFTSDFITPARRGQEGTINKPYPSPESSLVSTDLETMSKTSRNKTNLSFSCKFCKLNFSSSRQLLHHQKLKHPRMKSHLCKYCGRFFARTTVLTEHIRTHTGEKPFVCNICNKAFSQMTNLKRHQKIHNRKSITCRYCKAVFTDYTLLLKHIQTHGRSLDKIPKSFKSHVPVVSSDIYASISERIMNMAPKPGRVNIQNRKSTRQTHYPLNQDRSCLSNQEPSVVIDQADEQIFTPGFSSSLDSGFPSNYSHLQNLQEGNIEKQSGSTPIRLNLASHQNETISTWPWKTSLPKTSWSKPFVSKCGEQQIMKPKGSQKKDADRCVIPEPSGSQLSRLAEFSSFVSQPGCLNDTKKYFCRYCKRSFLQLNDLRTHSPCHGGEKRYQCKYCSRIFGRSSVLKQHIRIHTGEKPFKCDQCLRCFTQSSNLMRHMKLHRADNQILKNFDNKKKSHFRPFSHGFHKQLGYYGKSTFRKYNNKKSITPKLFELNAEIPFEDESSQKNISPPFSNLTYPSTTTQLSIITSQSHRDPLWTASKEPILIDSGNTMSDTTVIAPELNSLKQKTNSDESFVVLSSSRKKKTDTVYLQMNEENRSDILLQPENSTRTIDTNFMPEVETSSYATKVSFSIKAGIAANEEPMPSDHCGSNNYNQSIKNPRLEASAPRIGHMKPFKKLHVCKICKERFSKRWKLSSHLKSHSKRLFQCTFCEKGFIRSSVLKEHIRTHTGEKPFKCIHCQRSFSQMTNLKRHLKLHNKNSQTATSHSLTI